MQCALAVVQLQRTLVDCLSDACSYLRIFRCHQQLWMMQCPVVICGFGVDRHRAEHLLADQPVVSSRCHYLPAPRLTDWLTCSKLCCACVYTVCPCSDLKFYLHSSHLHGVLFVSRLFGCVPCRQHVVDKLYICCMLSYPLHQRKVGPNVPLPIIAA